MGVGGREEAEPGLRGGGGHPTQWHPGACLDLTVPSRFDQWVISTSLTTTFISTHVCLFGHVPLCVIWEEKGTWLEGIHQPPSPQRSGWGLSEPPREGERFHQVGVCRGSQKERQILHALTLSTPSPDSSQRFKLVTLYLPLQGHSLRLQVPGTQASP